MSDLILDLTSQPPLRLLVFMVIGYMVVAGSLWLFLRPTMAGRLDPLNIKLWAFLAPGFLGFLASPLLFKSLTGSYLTIVLFLGFWVAIVRLWGKPRLIDLEDRMDVDTQVVLLVLSMGVNLANILVNMVLPGKIPLLMENGSAMRFEATEGSRLLTWLMLGITPVGGMLYAVTGNSRVRHLAKYAVGLQVFQGLLFASKGGILTIVFILLNALFIARQRGEQKRYTQLLRSFKIATIVVAALIPLYLAVIGVGSNGSAIMVIAVRVLGGFDQLILTSQFDVLRHGSDLFHGNLFQYQLMPVFKVIGNKFAYSSVGQYVIEAATGVFIEGPYTLPNSNLILESLLTSGIFLGTVLYCLELAIFYWLRRLTLGSPITPITFVLVVATVFDPFGLFASGQEWSMETLLLAMTVGTAYLLALLWKGLRVISEAYA